jgi:hypothetical protein
MAPEMSRSRGKVFSWLLLSLKVIVAGKVISRSHGLFLTVEKTHGTRKFMDIDGFHLGLTIKIGQGQNLQMHELYIGHSTGMLLSCI